MLENPVLNHDSLIRRVAHVTSSALHDGALRPIHTSTRTVHERGFPLVVHVVSSLNDKTAARPFDPVFPVTLGDEYFPHHYIEHELQFR